MVSPATLLTRITEHVYWMKPDAPDRPSLCVVVGKNRTLMLDGASSVAHARLFLEALDAHQLRRPDYVALSHWHWDHVFGLAELGVPVIAHPETARQLGILAGYAWDDAALAARVASGEEIAFCADNIKLELPSPRQIDIVLPDILIEDRLTFDLGGVTCHVQHVGGDHASDSLVIDIQPDGVLFLGDCLYYALYAPVEHYTEQIFPLLERVLSFKAEHFIEGHDDSLLTRHDLLTRQSQFHTAQRLIETIQDSAEITGLNLDEDTDFYARTLFAGTK